MTERYELKLCSNGTYYVYENGTLTIPYIDFDKFNKESADELIDKLNTLYNENEQLKKDLKKQFVPFAKADGDYTTVNTEEFIKILNENEQLKQEKQELFDFFMNEYDRQEDESIDREIKLEEQIKELEKEKKQLEKLINERIKYLKENNFELLKRDKYNEIYILKWVLSIMNGDLK